jgi:cyclopropane fatty-acyl-phospholipid synthase-like methyltransferase
MPIVCINIELHQNPLIMNPAPYYDANYFNWQKQVGLFGGIANLFKFKDHIKETDAVLDFGCGGGYLLKNIKCHKKMGVEINDVARAEALKMDLEVLSDTSQIPDDFADVIVSNHTLEHVGAPLDALKALYPKLKREGKIIFVVPHQKSDEEYKADDINKHLYTWNPLTFGNLFNAAGYQVLKVEAIQHQWPPNYVEIYSKFGEKEFHRQCREFAVKNQNYQIRAIATRM